MAKSIRKYTPENLLGYHGPKTQQGKAVTRLNAAKHGMDSAQIILPHLGETARAWSNHLNGVIEQYQPKGYVEEEFACRIALAIWQLRRVDRYRAVKSKLVYEQADNWAMDAMTRGDMNANPENIRRAAYLPDSRSLEKADAHEWSLWRCLGVATSELQRLQAKRGVSVVLQVELGNTPESGNETMVGQAENGVTTPRARVDRAKPPRSTVTVTRTR